ncbi:hypothetical protein H310_02027 [Aphanomyces invadans]|uniref:Uncharacterized protein n=1 Tax=Aphanomyces invadans TaxID=157072 RepID=A0A024UPI5_9STRA|nr:hypothetical protein H310_02027 [Aphanomyces invadans]ETW07528.1 hypothetical protein H310_02027 [Aphanomyces invadans]|eukprot:XP_008863621.1 hypothetical protein H310_02027 [Aphanomyces invadans]
MHRSTHTTSLPILSPSRILDRLPSSGEGYLAMYLADKAQKDTTWQALPSKSCGKGSTKKAVVAPSPSISPLRVHRKRERSTIDLDTVKLVAGSLNVMDERRIVALFQQHIALTSELQSVHGKVAGYRATIDEERSKQHELQMQLEHCQSLLPLCQSHKAKQDAQFRAVDDAIAASVREVAQLKQTLADICAADKALDAATEEAHSSLQSQPLLAIEVDDIKRQLQGAIAELDAAKQHLRHSQHQHDAVLVELAQQTANETTDLRNLQVELGRSSQTCQDVAQLVARCTREYVDRTGCPFL